MRAASRGQLSFVLVILALSIGRATSEAQVVVEILRPRAVQDVLDNFEKTPRTGPSRTPYEFQFPEKYSPARVDSLLDGFERIALTAEENVAGEAAASIASAASAWHAPRGSFDRLLRVYQRSNSRAVRWMIVGSAQWSREHQRAIRFYESIATQDDANRDFDGSPFLAAEGLRLMGKDGLAVLTNLYNTKLMRDPKALGFTRWYLSEQAPSQRRKKCRADSQVLLFLVELERFGAATDRETVARRTAVARLPVVGPNQIDFVEDERVCRRLAAAIGNLSKGPPPSELYVANLGSKGFAAWDPTDPRGQYRTVHVFNNRYVRVGGWMEP